MLCRLTMVCCSRKSSSRSPSNRPHTAQSVLGSGEEPIRLRAGGGIGFLKRAGECGNPSAGTDSCAQRREPGASRTWDCAGAYNSASFNPAEALNERQPQVQTHCQTWKVPHWRNDVRISNGFAAEEAAQEKSVSVAKSSFGPKLNAFGSWETDTRTYSPMAETTG